MFLLPTISNYGCSIVADLDARVYEIHRYTGGTTKGAPLVDRLNVWWFPKWLTAQSRFWQAVGWVYNHICATRDPNTVCLGCGAKTGAGEPCACPPQSYYDDLDRCDWCRENGVTNCRHVGMM